MPRKRPTSWAIGLLLLLTAYGLAQPLLNGRLGWQLPSLAGLLGEPEPPAASGQPPQAESQATRQKSTGSDQASPLLHGVLKDIGRERYVSPAGLQYNPGSEEGHRLKHLERHLKDIPDRPGKHGVFVGDMPQVLKWIDDAYSRGKRGAKGVRQQPEDGRTVYEVPFSQPIGYVGGRDGKRDHHPPARTMRLVVDGNRFITAFPF